MATEPEALTQARQCPTHGEYWAIPIPNGGLEWRNWQRWTSCPECDAALQALVDKRNAEICGEPDPARRLEQRQEAAGVPERYRDARADDFDEKSKRGRVLRQAWDWFEDDGGSLLLIGPEGTGKTYTGCGLVNTELESEFADNPNDPARYTTVADMLRRIRATYGKGATETEQQALAAYTKVGLLAIDEVGRGVDSAHSVSVLFEIIDQRYSSELPTVLCSNMPSADLAAYLGPNILGRFREGGGKMLGFDWPSLRS